MKEGTPCNDPGKNIPLIWTAIKKDYFRTIL